MVGIVCAVVGTYVVLRGIAFIGDAIAHAGFPGVVVAYMLGFPLYIGAAIAAVATALSIGFVTRKAGIRQDTAIGVLFAGTFAFGVFLFSGIQGYVADLFSFLFGNVLAIGPEDLVALLLLGGGVLITVAVLWKELLYATFDPLGAAASGIKVERLEYLFLALVALTIVVSLQAVGIILVVAMLVTPAATAQLLAVRFTRLMLLAAVIGVVSAVIGLYASYWLDVASGATIVLVQTLLFALALVFGPRGLLGRRAAGRRGGPRRASHDAGREPRDGARRPAPRRRDGPGRAPAHRAAARGRAASSRRATATSRRPSSSTTRSGRGIGRATVFRSLDLFTSLGLVERVDLPGGDHAYVACERRPPPPRDLHRLRPLARRRRRRPGRGARRIGARSGFRVTAHRLEIFGLCAACGGWRPGARSPPRGIPRGPPRARPPSDSPRGRRPG